MATQEKTWNVANRLHSLKDSDNPAVNHIIAGADEIYDDAKGAKQSDINAQNDAALADRYTKAQVDAAIADIDVTGQLADYAKKTDVNTALATKQDVLTFDNTPTTGSTNPVTSGGVKTALGTKADAATTLAGYGITDGYTKTEGQALESAVDSRLDAQDAAVAQLDGHALVIVDTLPTDESPAETPDPDVIYRLYVDDGQGNVSYEDYMYNADDLTTPVKIATYALPGVDEVPTAGSQKLVKSGGVFNSLGNIELKVFDFSNNLNITPTTNASIGIKLGPGSYHVNISGSSQFVLDLKNGNTVITTFNKNNGVTNRDIIIEETTNILYLYAGSATIAQDIIVSIRDNNNPSLIKRMGDVEDEISSLSEDFSDITEDVGLNDQLVVKNDELSGILSGYHYNTSGVLTSNADSRYYEPIDISKYAGKNITLDLIVNYKNTNTDTRYCLVTTEDGTPLVKNRLYKAEALEGGGYILRFGVLSADAKYIKLSWVKGYVSKSNLKFTKIFDINSDVEVYVDSQNGNDNNKGTSNSPYATVAFALTKSKNVILKDGIYNESSIGLIDGANIRAEHTGKAVFLPSSNIVLEEPGTLVSGSEKVYQVSLNSAVISKINGWHYLYQFGINDPLTEIDVAYRLPVHCDKNYRCDFAAIKHVNSIEAIETNSYACFYVNTDNNILYYSLPSVTDISSSNFLFTPSNTNLFTDAFGKTFKLQGLKAYSLVLTLNGSINAEVVDCSILACGGGGCICFNSVTNLHLIRCEAARSETNYSSSTGDGFNSHNAVANRSIFTLEDCWSHDNYNDGYSDHENSEGTILRGVYEYNCIAHGGGLTPAFGAKDRIFGSVCQCNADDGIRYTGAPSSPTTCSSLIIQDAVIRNNSGNGVSVTNDTNGKLSMTCINVLSYDNSGYGFKNLNASNSVTCLNCKAVNNSGGDYSGCTNR